MNPFESHNPLPSPEQKSIPTVAECLIALEDRDTKSETKSPLIARLIRIANYEDDNYYKIVDYFNDPKIQIDLFQFGSTRDPLQRNSLQC
jgi:hypothetical protein